MQNTAAPRPLPLKRFFFSLAAIIAVTTIFGVKAFELEQRAFAAEASQAEKLAQTRLESRS